MKFCLYEFTNIFSVPTATMMFGLWLLIVFFLLNFLLQRWKRIWKTSWYDQSKFFLNGEMSCDAIKLCLKEITGITFGPTDLKNTRCKNIRWRRLPYELSLLFPLAIICFGSLQYILGMSIESPDNGLAVVNAANLELGNGAVTGVLALIGVVLTIFYQIRLTARTKNRKEWIKDIRAEMSILIANFPECSETNEAERFSKVKEHITKLELLLNPSERVHRIFLGVVYCKYGMKMIGEGNMESCNLIEEMGCSSTPAKCKCDKTTKIAIALGNILLKREWENVKHAR